MSSRALKVALINRENNSAGMRFDAALRAFITTRRRGTSTAKVKARPRTIEEYESDLKYFFDYMEHTPRNYTHWNQIKIEDFDDYIDWVQQKTGWADASQTKRLRSLRALLFWVLDDDECAHMRMHDNTPLFIKHLPSLPKASKKSYVPKPEELRKFADSFPTHTRSGLRNFTAFSLWVDTGMRQGELRHLRVDHVKLDEGFVLVPEEGKTGERVVYLMDGTMKDLRRWLRVRETFAKTDYLFVTDEGNMCEGKGFFSKVFQIHRRKLGMDKGPGKNITPHSLRHYFVTQWLRNGGDTGPLKTITGHKRSETLDGYMHLENDRSVADAHKKFSPRDSVLRVKSRFVTKTRAKI